MELMKWLGMYFPALFGRTSTHSAENNDMAVLGRNDLVSKLEMETIFPSEDHVRGINEIFIVFNERIDHEDIRVRFYEKKYGIVVWETIIRVSRYDDPPERLVSFLCPRYRSLKIDKPVTVYIEVWRLSDGAVTPAEPFKFLPAISGLDIISGMTDKQTAYGNSVIILACSQIINRNDIQVCFFEMVNGKVVWEKVAEIDYSGSIVSRLLNVICPSYKSLEIDVPVKLYLQCRRPSDGAKSRPFSFYIHPVELAEPLPLIRLCRRVIRLCMGDYEVEKRIDCLELPQEMKVFLLHRT